MTGYLIIRAGSYLYVHFGMENWTTCRNLAFVITDHSSAEAVADRVGGTVVPA